MKMIEAAVEEHPEVPIAIHLDHGPDFETCKMCIDAGFTSVMIDGSISACASIRSDLAQGNIYKDDFIDVWENRYQPYPDRNI